MKNVSIYKHKRLSVISYQKKVVSNKGFTLIELLVVFSVMSILGVSGVAGYLQFSQSQAVNTATADFVTMLQTAKFRALSQIKPTSGNCVSYTLSSYSVEYVSVTEYKMKVSCTALGTTYSDNILNEDKKLSTDSFSSITFTGSFPAIVFPTLSGGTASVTDVNITISGFSGKYSKVVIISPSGVISIAP